MLSKDSLVTAISSPNSSDIILPTKFTLKIHICSLVVVLYIVVCVWVCYISVCIRRVCVSASVYLISVYLLCLCMGVKKVGRISYLAYTNVELELKYFS